MKAPLHDLHPSNLLTYMSLGAGVGAVATCTRPGGISAAGSLIALSALLDTFDGWFARRFERTDRQARAGAALDSLVDASVFGVVPVVVMRAAPGAPGACGEIVWWTTAFVYVLAAVTRLAFFDAEGDKAGFVGVPTPAAALLWSTAIMGPIPADFVPAGFVLFGAAMVWPLAIRRPRGPVLALFAAWALFLVLGHAARAVGAFASHAP